MGEHYAQDAVYYHEVFRSLRKKTNIVQEQNLQ